MAQTWFFNGKRGNGDWYKGASRLEADQNNNSFVKSSLNSSQDIPSDEIQAAQVKSLVDSVDLSANVKVTSPISANNNSTFETADCPRQSHSPFVDRAITSSNISKPVQLSLISSNWSVFKDSPGLPLNPDYRSLCTTGLLSPCSQEEISHIMDAGLFPPFLDPVARIRPQPYGVVKIKNIPYSVTTQEISFFINKLSPNSPIHAHVDGFPIHIVIERPTGKTLEVYVEFKTQEHAQICVHRAQFSHRPLKIGQRHVTLEQSTQGELMAILFPRARCVRWDVTNGAPFIYQSDDPTSEGFRGFFTVEEMASVVKQAETPQRSPFSSRCLQRAYESMITTLYKFPWYATQHFTVNARNYLFTSYMAQLRVLVPKATSKESPMIYGNGGVGFAEREVGLSHALLMDFLLAGLNVPTFSLRQKFQITASCGEMGQGFPLTPHAFAWPFQCLAPPFETPNAVLESWLNMVSSGFNIMYEHKISHGFERYVHIVRDNCGFIVVEFTPVGSALHFSDAISIEKTLMNLMVEKGRMKWCLDRGIPYEALDAGKCNEAQPMSDISFDMERMQISQKSETDNAGWDQNYSPGPAVDDPGHALVARSNSPAPLTDSHGVNLFINQVDIIDNVLKDFKKAAADEQLAPATQILAKTNANANIKESYALRPQASNFTIDPTTPVFVPSQPWVNNRHSQVSTTFSMEKSFSTQNNGSTAFTDPFNGQRIAPLKSIPRSQSSPSNVIADCATGGHARNQTVFSNPSTAYSDSISPSCTTRNIARSELDMASTDVRNITLPSYKGNHTALRHGEMRHGSSTSTSYHVTNDDGDEVGQDGGVLLNSV